MTVIDKISKYLNCQTSPVPLAIFRMAFGFLMMFSMFRFLYKGWIEKAYVEPNFHFTYQYFDWIQPLGLEGMYGVVIVCGISALFVGLGLFYRWATILFFISFTYLELIEKSWYLNHYYFVSLVAFLLIWVPTNQKFSLDSWRNRSIHRQLTPMWTIVIFKLQLCIVYFFGGVAKLKSDWLLDAQPLSIWLKARTDLPFIGSFLEYDITPYLFSWSGMCYDLLIPFLLWFKKSRPIAFLLVLIFHVLTYILFPIGMFPWLMIFGSLIFIKEDEWRTFLHLPSQIILNNSSEKLAGKYLFAKAMLGVFFVIQVLVPLRHFVLTDNVLWTENGFRFSWHVMVMEKNGYSVFTVYDEETGKQWTEYPSRRLSSIQEKQMSFQPDMIWQYAQYLKQIYQEIGVENPEVYVNSRVSLNGRPSQHYIKNTMDLTQIKNVDDIYSYVRPMQ